MLPTLPIYFQQRCHDNSLGKGNPTNGAGTTDTCLEKNKLWSFLSHLTPKITQNGS